MEVSDASHAFLIPGSVSESGHPLLASDTHGSLTIPSLYILNKLRYGGKMMQGASVAGVPLVVSGKVDGFMFATATSQISGHKVTVKEGKKLLDGPNGYDVDYESLGTGWLWFIRCLIDSTSV